MATGLASPAFRVNSLFRYSLVEVQFVVVGTFLKILKRALAMAYKVLVAMKLMSRFLTTPGVSATLPPYGTDC